MNARENDIGLQKKVDAAIGVLGAGGDGPDPTELVRMPSSVLRQRLTEAALDRGLSPADARLIADTATDPRYADEIAETALAHLRDDDQVATALDHAYERRDDLMAIDPLTVAAGALMLLVLRVKSVRISRESGTAVDFEPLSRSVIAAVLDWVSRAGP